MDVVWLRRGDDNDDARLQRVRRSSGVHGAAGMQGAGAEVEAADRQPQPDDQLFHDPLASSKLSVRLC